jgi:hypothetical protein
MFCLFIPFAVIHFVVICFIFLYSLSLYVLSLGRLIDRMTVVIIIPPVHTMADLVYIIHMEDSVTGFHIQLVQDVCRLATGFVNIIQQVHH